MGTNSRYREFLDFRNLTLCLVQPINYSWGSSNPGLPIPIPSDNWTVIYDGCIFIFDVPADRLVIKVPETGVYTFYLDYSDFGAGVRLAIDNTVVLESMLLFVPNVPLSGSILLNAT